MELEKKYIIQDNFIGIFDNFFPKHMINDLLEYYNNAEKNFLTYGRVDKEKEMIMQYHYNLLEILYLLDIILKNLLKFFIKIFLVCL
jgi:hypothetical protein